MPATDDPRPEAPVQPELEDCCNSGCYPCIFDTYEDAMDRYRSALKAWEKRNIPAKPGLFKRTKKLGAP